MPFETVMPFGEFRGLRLIDIPADRCAWLLGEWRGRNSLGPWLRRKLQERVDLKSEESSRG